MADGLRLTEERVWEALAEIPDPEIPPISIVDLGVVRAVSVEVPQHASESSPSRA